MKTIKEKRLEVLHEIDKLNPRRCKKCHLLNGVEKTKSICDCEVDKEVRKLGERLMELVRVKNDETESLILQINSREDITPSLYRELKRNRCSDKRIARQAKIGEATLNRWKRREGLMVNGGLRDEAELLS